MLIALQIATKEYSMPLRLRYHLEPKSGWMNDPNGLIFYKGQYHAFYQHNPYKPKWDKMHWGHAVSKDLINWQHLPIALTPDQPYEDDGGCFSGSAVQKDGVLYLFYTSVSKELGQTQSVAYSTDGINFTKYENNPVITCPPEEGSADFRDPKVTQIGDTYYMVCGSGKDGVGKVLLYSSHNLFDWQYVGVLFESSQYSSVLECPDFFEFGGKYMLMFSVMNVETRSTVFIWGDFDGQNFVPLKTFQPEVGPQFYAPQTFEHLGQRIMIGWLYDWNKQLDQGAQYAGALTIPRVLHFNKAGELCNFPVTTANQLLIDTDEHVRLTPEGLAVSFGDKQYDYVGEVKDVHILRDTKTLEVFVNGGECSFTLWIGE